MTFRLAESKSCFYFGWTLLFQGFWLFVLYGLMTFSIKLGSQIFQNNALVKVPYALKIFLTQEHGKNCYYYYWCCKKSGYWNNKIRSIWYLDELIELYEVFFQQRIKNQGFYRQSKKLWYVPWFFLGIFLTNFFKQKAAIRLQGRTLPMAAILNVWQTTYIHFDC